MFDNKFSLAKFAIFENLNIYLNKIKLGSKKETIYEFVKNVVCENQGMLAEYNFQTSERHKRLQNELLRGKKSGPEKLKIFKEDLDNYLHHELVNICHKNIKLLLGYFSNRSKFPTRLCVKVPKKNKVITLDRSVTRLPEIDFNIQENEAFSCIHRTSECYICNDIPEAIKKNEYRNKKIDIEKVKRFYKQPSYVKRIIYRKKPDNHWMQFWEISKNKEGSDIPLIPEDCYKSTMVIPMTFQNNKMSVEFKKKFKISDSPNIPKSIYGYLCADNHLANFFIMPDDICIGYLFSDLLSLFFVINSIFTEYSDVYNNAKNHLK